MQTNVVAATRQFESIARTIRGSRRHAQRVLIVNGDPESLVFLEAIVEAGHYDVVFVEAVAHAYSQIKKVKPDLVILCVNIDDVDSLQVLSMLRLDEETRSIPVLTYATDNDFVQQQDEEEEVADAAMPLFGSHPAARMN